MSSQPIKADGLPRVTSTELDYLGVRDDLVRAYQPATAEEMLLVNQIARAWYRLQRYYDYELALMEEQKISKMFDSDLERFKVLQRTIAAAERMWRNAVNELKAARRRKPAAAPPVTVRRYLREADEDSPISVAAARESPTPPRQPPPPRPSRSPSMKSTSRSPYRTTANRLSALHNEGKLTRIAAQRYSYAIGESECLTLYRR